MMESELSDSLNMADYFLDARVRSGDGPRTALVFDREGYEVERFSYRDVQRHADRFAHALVALGVEPEQRVVIAATDGPDFVAALFGALKVGAVAVMVNPEVEADEAAYVAGLTRAKVCVVSPGALPSFRTARTRANVALRLLTLGTQRQTGPWKPDGAHAPGLPPRGEPLSYDVVAFEALAPMDPPPFPTFASHPDDAAIWLFSGGTNGRPKAVIQTHGAFVNTTRKYAHGVLGYRHADLTLSVPKLFFGYATGSNLLFPFSVGAASLLFPERATPARLFDLIERHRPSILVNVPTMAAKLLDAPGSEERDLSSIRLCTSAGESLPAALFERFRSQFGIELLDGLGTAEMWHIFLTNRPGEAKPGTLGRPVPGFDVRVCDDDGTELADGEVGWLWVRGGSRALGYVQQHALSCKAFRGEWYVSGDMVRRDADGTFSYCGRGDDMLKVSGKWLAPQEVEACLSLHPAVAECAVVGMADASGLTRPSAFVRARAGLSVSLDDLRAWAQARLAPYKIPREVNLVDEFPRTHFGKIDRGRLRKAGLRQEEGTP